MSDNDDGAMNSRSGPPMVPATHQNPFAKGMADHLAAGAVTIESERAVAEIQAKIIIAKRFPRDEQMCLNKVKEACQRPEMAAVAFYSYSRGEGKVSGPSIRLAEELVRCWSNMDYGLKELSNRNGETEMLAYAWDMQNNNYSQQAFVVKHIRDTRGGGKELKEQRDIYEIGANMGARRMRARMLAILPDWYVNAAITACKQTIEKGGGQPLPDRIANMVAAFATLGVTADMLIKRLGHPLDQITPSIIVDLTGTYRALRDGQTTIEEEFSSKPSDDTADAVKAAAKAGAAEATQTAAPATTAAAPAAKEQAAPAQEKAKEPPAAKQAEPEKKADAPAAAEAKAPAAEPAKPKETPPKADGGEVLF